MLVESCVRREVQARFGGEFLETYRRNTARHRVLSLRLTSQYLFLFAAGMLASLLLTMVLYMAGADRTLCILVALVCMSLVVWGTFRMNRCYGPHGLMKRLAARRHSHSFLQQNLYVAQAYHAEDILTFTIRYRRSIRHLIVKRN